MPCCTKSLIFTGFSILIDLTNLFEQTFLYLLTYGASVDDRSQRIFFFIMVSIYTLSLKKSLVQNKRKEIIISTFIESAEFVTYITLHKTVWKNFPFVACDVAVNFFRA